MGIAEGQMPRLLASRLVCLLPAIVKKSLQLLYDFLMSSGVRSQKLR